MALQLPPLNLPILMDLSKLTQQARQVEQVVNQATGSVKPIAMSVDTSSAQRSVQQLTAQMRALQTELAAQVQGASASRQSIAELASQQASLRAQVASTVVTMREQGASTRDIATATAQMRVGIVATAAAIAEERTALVAATAAQQQYRGAITQTRAQLAALDADSRKAQESIRNTTNAARGSGGGGSPGFLSGLTSTTSLGQGIAFGAGAMVGREAFDLLSKSIGGAKAAIIDFNGDLEQTHIAFTTFLGGAQQADVFLQQLQQFANQTPFQFPQLVDDTKKMLAFGFSAQQVLPMLTAIGNATAGLGSGSQGLDRISLALGQMQAKGRVEAQDLRQLQEAGVATGEIFALLAQQTGTTTAQLQDMASKGALSSQVFIGAFQQWSNAKFGDMMQQQSHTFQGAMSNIDDAVEQVLARIGQPFFAAVSRAAQALSAFLTTPQFAAWARAAQQAVGSVIGILGQLAGVAADVARSLGLPVPHIDFSGATKGAQEQQTAIAGVNESQIAMVRQAAAYTDQVSGAAAEIKKVDADLAGLKDKQDALTNSIQDTKQGYEDQITPLERQLRVLDQLTEGEKARRARSYELEGQEIQVRLAMPDTTGLDAAIEQLKRDKEDLGKFDPSQWDTALDSLRDKLNAIAHEDTKTLQHAMEGVQEQLYQLGRQNTDAFDKQIRDLREKIDSLSTAQIDAIDKNLDTLQSRLKGLNTDDLDRQIDSLKAKLDEPGPDTSAMTNQLAVLGAQLQMGGGNATRQQFATLSAQKAGILSNYALQQTGLRGQIAALTAERQAQKEANDLAKVAIQSQIDGLESQKKSLQETNDLRKKGWEGEIRQIETRKQAFQDSIGQQRAVLEDQLHGMELTKRAQDEDRESRRQALQDQVDGLTKEKEAARAAFQANIDTIDENIRLLTRQKEDALAPYNAALKQIEAEKTINGLLDRRDELARKIAEQPIKDKIAETKLAEEDALAPLNRRLQLYDREARALESRKRQLEQDKQAAEDALASILALMNAGKGASGAAVNVGGSLTNAIGGAGGAGGFIGPIEQTGVLAGLQRLRTWLDENKPEIEGDLGDILTALGNIADFLKFVWPFAVGAAKLAWNEFVLGLKVGNQAVKIVKDVLTGDWEQLWRDLGGETKNGTQSVLTVYDEFGRNLGEERYTHHSATTGLWTRFTAKLKAAWDGPDGFNWGSIGGFFVGIEHGVDGFARDHFPSWLTSWSGLAKGLRTLWDGPDGFNWGSIGGFFGGILSGVDGFATDHFPSWLTSWGGLASGLRTLWDGPQGFNWGSIGGFFSGILSGMNSFATDNFPGWLTSWGGLATGLGDAFKGLGGVIGGHVGEAAKALGNFFSFIGSGVHWLAKHFPGVSDIPDFGNDNGVVAPGSGSVGSFGSPSSPPTGGLAVGTDNWRGGPAILGEAGRELLNRGGRWEVVNKATLMDLPQGAVVLPNHVTEFFLGSGVPAFAAGLNFDFLGDALGGISRFVTGTAEKAVNAIMDKIGTPSVDFFPGLGTSLFNTAKGGLLNFLRPQEVAQNLGSAVFGGASGGGFLDMALNAFMAYMARFGGPVDTESAFNDLRAVGREDNIDPRWLMAVMETESAYGNTAGRLGRVWNFGGMGVNNRGFGFDSGIQATDSSMHFAGYANLHDFLEDIGAWVAQNGTSFVSYDGSGVAKNAAHQALLSAIPVIGGAASSGLQGGNNAIVDAAASYLGQSRGPTASGFWAWYCERFVDFAIRDATGNWLGYPSAFSHANSVRRFDGRAPAGATYFFDESWGPDGHVAIAVGNGRDLISTLTPNGAPISVVPWEGRAGNMGWAPPGLATGGIVTREGIFRLGEGNKREAVIPLDDAQSGLPAIVGARRTNDDTDGTFVAVFEKDAISVDRDGNVTVNDANMKFTRARRNAGIAG